MKNRTQVRVGQIWASPSDLPWVYLMKVNAITPFLTTQLPTPVVANSRRIVIDHLSIGSERIYKNWYSVNEDDFRTYRLIDMSHDQFLCLWNLAL